MPDAPEDYLDNGAGQDTEELERRAARRHSGWVPSTSNGAEVTMAARELEEWAGRLHAF